jgi:predicted AAA+ superfamily ATPase
MLSRDHYLEQIRNRARLFPVVTILGPRQCGKTTLAKMFLERASGEKTFYDLESPGDRNRLTDPELALSRHRGWVVLDEIQHLPALFEVLRVLADRPDRPATFLILGSAALELMKGVSETLAGRVGFVDLAGFVLEETGVDQLHRLWIRGGFPRSFLAETEEDSAEWRRAFVRTFLERDIPQLGFSIPAESLRRFWTMIAHYHGQVWNAAEFARSLGTSESTARRYLDLLSGAYMVRVLQPWHENLKKRQVKAPKVYVRDSGLLHSLLGIDQNMDAVMGHPKAGSSWEGFVIEEMIRRLETRQAYFWATHAGAELDLLVLHGGERLGFEIKLHSAPKASRSLHIAAKDLGLDRVMVIHAGDESYPLSAAVEAISLAEALQLFKRRGE